MPAEMGLVGLAVMGQNLALNLADHGHGVVVYNRTPGRTREFLAGAAAGTGITGVESLPGLVAALSAPRRILLMVKAGAAVDATLAELAPLLGPGDIVVDGGNSHPADTERRLREMSERGIRFVGAGISGGEEGARHGPSIMPGGDPAAWPAIAPLLQSIAARVADGTPCCDWIGPGGSGHFVKMVHNGIEYGDMQLLAEAYHLMRSGLGMSHDEIGDCFATWNRGRLESYLVEITAAVVRHRQDGEPVVEHILDAAGQKGTGRWTVESALELGQPLTLAAEAVFARAVSALVEERRTAAGVLGSPIDRIGADRQQMLVDLEAAVFAAKVISYAQGFMLLGAASRHHDWSLDPGRIALLWRQGCIIRAAFLERIHEAYRSEPGLSNLMLAPHFTAALGGSLPGWRRVVSAAVSSGIPVPALSSALAFFDAYRSDRLPANLIQAMRDYFGAHTYERVDRPRGEFFHTDWTGTGGAVASGSYQA